MIGRLRGAGLQRKTGTHMPGFECWVPLEREPASAPAAWTMAAILVRTCDVDTVPAEAVSTTERQRFAGAPMIPGQSCEAVERPRRPGLGVIWILTAVSVGTLAALVGRHSAATPSAS